MIKRDIFNGNLKEQLKASANDRIHRFVMADGMLKGAVVRCDRMVKEMRANHELDIVETLLLGHGYIAAALLTATLKHKDRIGISIECSGPVKGIDLESNVYGEIRGFLKNSRFSERFSGQETNMSSFFGAGFLTVTKYLTKAAKPYSGKILLEYGSIAKDLANYFVRSEQTPTAFNLSVCFDSPGNVAGAGGLFIQAMPGAEEGILEDAENMVRAIGSIGKKFSEQIEPETLIMDTFGALNPVFMENSRVEFYCRCSQDKMKGYLRSLPRDDIKDIIDNGPFPLEIRCHHCNSLYRFNRPDIEQLNP